MAIEESDLSSAEISALKWIRKGAGTEVSRIEEKASESMWGDVVPGMAVFKRLEKKGLCYQTLEDPILLDEEDGETFEFSSTMELTDEGLALVKRLG
ncbi:hypothetical protein [Pseudomonas putida]|uniref:Uncharacterized protein n=1 Tax=Pseudomonas putida TaxID=303 RepID=A0A8I1JIL2_PSEPU|nr:hypothetical protein [Pseudomonas putida]MBI6883088.1 hypothetical protein [Pseudomonas putida]